MDLTMALDYVQTKTKMFIELGLDYNTAEAIAIDGSVKYKTKGVTQIIKVNRSKLLTELHRIKGELN